MKDTWPVRPVQLTSHSSSSKLYSTLLTKSHTLLCPKENTSTAASLLPPPPTPPPPPPSHLFFSQSQCHNQSTHFNPHHHLLFSTHTTMGACTSKPQKPNPYASRDAPNEQATPAHLPKSQPPPPPPQNDAVISDADAARAKKSPFLPFFSPSPSPAHYFKKSPAHAKTNSATSTPLRFFKRPFPPPSPAKHIRSVLLRRQGKKAVKSSAATAAAIPEDEEEEEMVLDKRFGFSKEFTSRLEVGVEVGRGHFGYTCSATFKKGEHKGHQVAVKVIPKSKVQLSFSFSFFILL